CRSGGKRVHRRSNPVYLVGFVARIRVLGPAPPGTDLCLGKSLDHGGQFMASSIKNSECGHGWKTIAENIFDQAEGRRGSPGSPVRIGSDVATRRIQGRSRGARLV